MHYFITNKCNFPVENENKMIVMLQSCKAYILMFSNECFGSEVKSVLNQL